MVKFIDVLIKYMCITKLAYDTGRLLRSYIEGIKSVVLVKDKSLIQVEHGQLENS